MPGGYVDMGNVKFVTYGLYQSVKLRFKILGVRPSPSTCQVWRCNIFCGIKLHPIWITHQKAMVHRMIGVFKGENDLRDRYFLLYLMHFYNL